jgi:hypothetical protein
MMQRRNILKGAVSAALDAPVLRAPAQSQVTFKIHTFMASEGDVHHRGPARHEGARALASGDLPAGGARRHAMGMPLRMSPNGISKGTLDAAVLPWQTVPAVKLDELSRFHSEFPAGTGALYTTAFVMADKEKIATLPPIRAARLHEVGTPFPIDRIPAPQPGPRDVQVRVQACGVVPNLRNVITSYTAKHPSLPAAYGLDAARVVTQVGSAVHGIVPGARVWTPISARSAPAPRSTARCRACTRYGEAAARSAWARWPPPCRFTRS